MKKNNKKLKAFVLAAGFGTRLSPLTESCPKPLLPFMNQPILFHILDQIKETEIKDVCINTHYKKDIFKEALSKYEAGPLNITLSEEEILLDTGGGLGAVSAWRGSSDLLVINSDIIHTFSLNDLIHEHQKGKADVTLAVTEKPQPTKTLLWCEDSRLFAFDKKQNERQTPHTFACLQMLSHRLLDTFPKKGAYSIIPIYKKLLEENSAIQTCVLKGFWADVGTIEDYLACHSHFFKAMEKGLKRPHPAFKDIPGSMSAYKKNLPSFAALEQSSKASA